MLQSAAASVGTTKSGKSQVPVPTLSTISKQHPAVSVIEKKLSVIIAASTKQLAGTSMKAKSAVFLMLRSLFTLLQVWFGILTVIVHVLYL
jgi:hypothetical protein